MLVDTDERGNRILDSIDFGRLQKDTVLGRNPDGVGAFVQMPMTPGGRNGH